jgi:hypothetical protein
VGFHDLVRIMVEHDLRLAEKERLLIDNGHMVVTAPEASYA